jgi:hypothetical protein
MLGWNVARPERGSAGTWLSRYVTQPVRGSAGTRHGLRNRFMMRNFALLQFVECSLQAVF